MFKRNENIVEINALGKFQVDNDYLWDDYFVYL